MNEPRNQHSLEPDENTIVDGERLEDRVSRMVREAREKQLEEVRNSVAKPRYYEPHKIARTRRVSGVREDRV